jgi:cation-transporting ATPase 13A3/4/5
MISTEGKSALLEESKTSFPCKMHPEAEEESKVEEVICLHKSAWKVGVFYLGVVISAGLLFLLAWWFTKLKVKLQYQECRPNQASHVWVKTKHGHDLVPTATKFIASLGAIITFEHHCMPFYFSDSQIEPLLFEVRLPYQNLIDQNRSGATQTQVEERRLLLGRSEISVPVKTVPRLMVEEVLHPFFVFQVFSCVLWYWDNYYYYASAIVLISSVSLASNLITTRSNLLSIRALAISNRPKTIIVLREEKTVQLQSWEIVPGDLIEVQSNWVMPCDAVLFQGNCVVDEGMLTGESTPVLKDPLPYLAATYDIEQDKRHSLYEGTKVIQSRAFNGKTYALVTRTGFQTFKGRLVRSIMFPKPNRFKFYEDSLKFIAVLASIALVGFFVTLPRQLSRNVGSSVLVDRSLDLITVTVPPALPAAMAVGTAFAIARLRKQLIICTSPPRVNVSGRVDTVVFDKTGTITEDGMDLQGLRPAVKGVFQPLTLQIKELMLLQENMATCHSLTSYEGELLGDPQELRIFNGANWSFQVALNDAVLATVRPTDDASRLQRGGEVGQTSPLEVGIWHIFHFNSNIKRMGVITKSLREPEFRLHVKGAPEVIMQLCRPSTVPSDFNAVLEAYTQAGLRVLACATKLLPNLKPSDLKSLQLQDLEAEVDFLGLIVLENRLKPETMQSLEDLRAADINVLMATGDNLLTAVAVAKACHMITHDKRVFICEVEDAKPVWHLYSTVTGIFDTDTEEHVPWVKALEKRDFVLALSGEAFGLICKNAQLSSADAKLLGYILDRGEVFARMSPEQKSMLIEELQGTGRLVAMCGDGANDCGALKRADVGISLSSAEASIAAPFTSQVANISCVSVVLREGRCALATSLQEFKYMALYSMIQFVTVATLYWFAVNLTDPQFLIIDLFTILPLAMFMSKTGPHSQLSKVKPIGELISFTVLSSVIGQTALVTVFQVTGLYLVVNQSFYSEVYVSDANDQEEASRKSYCYENTVLFLISMAQYTLICFVFSIGKPFKKPAYSNYWLTADLAVLSIITAYIVIDPADWTRHLFGLKPLPWDFRFELLGLCVIYGVCATLYEHLVVTAVDIWAQQRALRLSS